VKGKRKMADSRQRIIALLELGKKIVVSHAAAVQMNIGPACHGDYDNEYIDTAKAVENIFIKNGWFAPAVKPDFSNTSDDNWYPAHNGTETPFVSRSGKRLLYCFQPSTGNHSYLDVDNDIILTDEDARLHLGTY
jgi:hypothetical protein